MINFLDVTLSSFDGSIFSAMHILAETTGNVFTPFFQFVTLIGEKGLVFFLSALILMLFPKTRKLGVCMFGAVACGAIITNILLKDLIARARPFENNVEYQMFWEFVGCPAEDGYSFPSGHMTAIMSAMTALFIFCNKKWSWVGFVGVLLMGISRVYLIAHYTTDVLAGIIVGGLSGIIAYFITQLIFKILNKNMEKKFCLFILDFDIAKCFKKKK